MKEKHVEGKYCENCGAKLPLNARFCDKCGTKVENIQLQTEPGQAQKGRRKLIIVVVIGLFLVILGSIVAYAVNSGVIGISHLENKQTESEDESEEVEENATLKDSLEWNESSEDIERFKKLSLSGFPDVSIGDVIMGDYSVISWKYAFNDNTQYLMCNYLYEDNNCVMIFYKDIYENINIAEYYVENDLQEKNVTNEAVEAMFQRQSNPQDNEGEDESASESSSYEIIRIAQVPPEGIYWEGDKPPYYAAYYVEVSNSTDDSFDFAIYQAQTTYSDGGTSDFQLVFKRHTAVFTDAYHAVYEGQQYTLYFECGRNAGYITVSGFNEVIPDGSELYNNSYLGVS